MDVNVKKLHYLAIRVKDKAIYFVVLAKCPIVWKVQPQTRIVTIKEARVRAYIRYINSDDEYHGKRTMSTNKSSLWMDINI